MSCSSVQVDAARLVHGSRASMNYTNSTFDGPHIPSKPSSHRTFLSSERMQIADLNAVLASRPEVFRTPSKVRVPDSPLLEDSPERRVLASNTAPFSRTNPTCLYTSDPFDRAARSGSPVSPRKLPLPVPSSPLRLLPTRGLQVSQ